MPDGTTEVTGDWITITETTTGNYELVASPIDDTLVTGFSTDLVLKTTLPTQPNHVGITETLAVTVTAATCDCNLLTWDLPGAAETITVGVSITTSNTVTVPKATVNEASKTATPAIRVCATTTPCVLTYTESLINVSESALPSFMTYDDTTLTILPTTAAHLGVRTLQLTQTVSSGTNPVFDAVVVTIDCTLTSVDDPSNPSTQTYYIYDPTMTIDLTALGVIYTQTPPCELAVTETYTWTGVSDAAAISEVSGNPMQLTIVSNKNTEAGTFSVTLLNDIAYSS